MTFRVAGLKLFTVMSFCFRNWISLPDSIEDCLVQMLGSICWQLLVASLRKPHGVFLES